MVIDRRQLTRKVAKLVIMQERLIAEGDERALFPHDGA